MNFYCKHCRKPLMHGQQMCSCGQLFDNPVPENDGQVGVVYWEPPRPSSRESQVQRVKETWDGVNPAAKAGGFGALAVLLIAFAIVGSHHAAPVVKPQIMVAPVVRPVIPIQPSAPSMPAPVVLREPEKPPRGNNVDWSKVDSGNIPSADGSSSTDATQTNQADSGQQQTQESQMNSIGQQIQQCYEDGVSAYQQAKQSAAQDQGFMGGAAGVRDLSVYANKMFADSKAIRSLESSVSDEQQRNVYETSAVKLDTMAQWATMPGSNPPY